MFPHGRVLLAYYRAGGYESTYTGLPLMRFECIRASQVFTYACLREPAVKQRGPCSLPVSTYVVCAR